MKKLQIILLALFTIGICSCKDKNKETEPEVVTVDNNSEIKPHEIEDTGIEFNDAKVKEVFDQYLQVENALINTDAEKAAKEAFKLQEVIKGVDDDAITSRAINAIADTDDIEVQRHNFVALTTSMEDILEGAIDSGTVYKQYCPMAFNNTGAYWFSNSKEIFNPYFGEKMLKCGRVEAEIK